jgi:predicted SnoaL-like aldol condensation-catalyzing enzyme
MSSACKQIALEFLRTIIAGQVREAYERYVSDGFRHHNPWFRGDAASLMAGMEDSQRTHPDKAFEIQFAIAEGDRVAVYSQLRQFPGHTGIAVVHMFRFEGDRIAELWDIAQQVPENVVNENGMF